MMEPANSPTTAPQPSRRRPRKPRGKGLRTNRGCATCRKRHMKCDEARPICGACSKSKRECVYNQPPRDDSPRRPSNVSDVTSPPMHLQSLANMSLQSGASRRSSHAARGPVLATTSVTGQGLPMTNRSGDSYDGSAGDGFEAARHRWFELLSEEATAEYDPLTLKKLSGPDLARRCGSRREAGAGQYFPFQMPTGVAESRGLAGSSKPPRESAGCPASPDPSSGGLVDLESWQTGDPLCLTARERAIFHHYATGVAMWIDMFDPDKCYSSLVPHLALRNGGLLKAVLALGARHLSIKSVNREDINTYRTAAVQYYDETLQYLQFAMRFTSYISSPQFLATSLVVSKYEMISGAGQEWERHLIGVFGILRNRNINGESGGIEQATWWAWLRQDVWAAFREHRRCFSFFKPRKSYQDMGVWDTASRIVYILAQAVNYASDEERQHSTTNMEYRFARGAELLRMLDDWRHNTDIRFDPLPDNGPSNGPFRPWWIHPPALGASLQMYCMARILLLINQPVVPGHPGSTGRDKTITECIDMVGGIALRLSDDACRLVSTQCLFAAGLCCVDDGKRRCIVELIMDHQNHTGWPSDKNLAAELHEKWTAQDTSHPNPHVNIEYLR